MNLQIWMTQLVASLETPIVTVSKPPSPSPSLPFPPLHPPPSAHPPLPLYHFTTPQERKETKTHHNSTRNSERHTRRRKHTPRPRAPPRHIADPTRVFNTSQFRSPEVLAAGVGVGACKFAYEVISGVFVLSLRGTGGEQR